MVSGMVRAARFVTDERAEVRVMPHIIVSVEVRQLPLR